MTTRKFSTTVEGKPFTELMINLVWNKSEVVMGQDPELVRKDSYGHRIKRYAYGDISTPFGWEIDHIIPVAGGGGDSIDNLQPLQWRNNRNKADQSAGQARETSSI